MPLEKKLELASITIRPSGALEIKYHNVIRENGEVIAKSNHRQALMPGDDLAGHDPLVIDVAAKVWTQERIEKAREIRNG